MFEYYIKDDLWYLYLDPLLKINETYTINPLDISWMINIDIDSQSHIFGIEIIPATYLSNLKLLKYIELIYDKKDDILIIRFSDAKITSIVKNEGQYYDPPINFNGNFEIWISIDGIAYFKISNASLFLSSKILSRHSLPIKVEN